MKPFVRDILLSFLMGMILPVLILGVIVGLDGSRTAESDSGSGVLNTSAVLQVTLPPQQLIPILLEDGTVANIGLEDYLCGVVLAEMPADFEPEALKAQSVVARTYVLRRLENGTKHGSGAVCTDSACCQGYITEDDYLNKGGTQSDIRKISQAVLETAGEVVTYDGKLIDATYFSCSGGRTEDASAVWGNDVPYLQATYSPGEEEAACFADTVVFTPEQVEQALSVTLAGDSDGWFTVLSYTEGGGVGQIDVCGSVFSGVELRKLLSLRSTLFTVTASDDSVVFETRGYGHRVGLSQYGADAMAVSGSTYEEILAHYYSGTAVGQYEPDD